MEDEVYTYNSYDELLKHWGYDDIWDLLDDYPSSVIYEVSNYYTHDDV